MQRNKVFCILTFCLFILASCTTEQTSIVTYQTESQEPISDITNDLTEQEMRAMLESANYCTAASDCAYVGTQCPFGCNLYANKAEAERIKAALNSFQSQCVYKCMACEGVQCVNNSCQAVCP